MKEEKGRQLIETNMRKLEMSELKEIGGHTAEQ